MIIDRDGNVLEAYFAVNGIVIEDGIFSICVDYDAESRENAIKIKELKNNLENTDYKAIKHADGALTDEEYEPIRLQREAWRTEINKLELNVKIPTITEEEVKAAEEKALESIGMDLSNIEQT